MSGIRRNLAGIYFKTVACTKTNEIVIESENKSVREQIYIIHDIGTNAFPN